MTTTHPAPSTPTRRRRSGAAPAALKPRTASPDVALAVWPVGQVSAQYQRAGRYHSSSASHPGKMLPALARRIVAEFSTPGSVVCDPMAGSGTTLVEAALLGRRAVGVELEPRWAEVAEANLDHVLDEEHRRLAEVRVGDARRLDATLAKLHGRIDLICTSPPYACDVGLPVVTRVDGERRLHPAAERNYSDDRANLGFARGPEYEAAMTEIYAACLAALRPGGLLVTVTKSTRQHGRAVDLAGRTVALATGVGFTYVAHVIALHAAIRDGGLVGRPSFWQTIQVRRARERGEPAHLTAHEDVVCLSRGTARLSPVAGSEVRDAQ